MAKFGISQSVRRVEDVRFITGQGQYTDDLHMDGETQAFVVRAQVAHAVIKSMNIDAAKSAPGVVAVITGADLDAAEANTVPCIVPMVNQDGSKGAMPNRPVMTSDKVRFVGDAVALVVAETLAQAKDAAELIEIDYDTLPAVADTATAAQADATVHDQAADNKAFDWAFGDAEAVDAKFQAAAHVTKLDLINNRLVAHSMEPRAAIASWDAGAEKLTFYANTQGGWPVKGYLADAVLKVKPEQVRVITPDVGGGFGAKIFYYPEHGAIAWASRQIGRPVRWIPERGDAFVSDAQGRDHVTHAELALDADHKILGMRVQTTANLGAYLSMFAPFIPTMAALKVLPGVYDVQALHYQVNGMFTNTVPVDAYRGAGRPESIYMMERLIDKAARDLKIDPTDIRRKNFIQPAAMPFKTAAGEEYDTGEFAKVMDTALANADWKGLAGRRAASAAAGKRRGIGMCYYIESTMGNGNENAVINFRDDDSVEILVGTQSNGQGHETAYAQIVNEKLGIPIDRIHVVQGDTDLIPTGGGTGGSRSVTAEGWALLEMSDKVIETGKAVAAQVMEAAVSDIEFGDGEFRIAGTDRSMPILTLAKEARARDEKGLDTEAAIEVKKWTFPNGCHIAEVEIDPETGVTTVERYTVVDDFGKLINPLLVAGQVHGGVVQGLGQALLEHTVYDNDGQLLSGSLMDYCLPRADNSPSISFSNVEVPCINNPLGMKGCGEAGAVGSPGAIINAMIDALADLGIDAIDMPATAESVWRTINKAA